jgi:hypothetical protein
MLNLKGKQLNRAGTSLPDLNSGSVRQGLWGIWIRRLWLEAWNGLWKSSCGASEGCPDTLKCPPACKWHGWRITTVTDLREWRIALGKRGNSPAQSASDWAHWFPSPDKLSGIPSGRPGVGSPALLPRHHGQQSLGLAGLKCRRGLGKS